MVTLVKQYLSQFKGGEENTANFTVDIFDMLHFIAKNKNDEFSQVILESAISIFEAIILSRSTHRFIRCGTSRESGVIERRNS